MSTLARYWLYQVPGILLATVLLLWLWPKTGLPFWIGALAWSAWLIKDIVAYPLVRSAYERRIPTGADRLVGEVGVTGTELTPFGQVRVRGEVWRARAADGTSVPAGAAVRVQRAEGLTLFVSTDGTDGAASANSG